MKIKCPSCSTKLDVTDLNPFTVFPCPRCGYEVTVPMRFQTYVLEEYLESGGGIHRYRALEEKLDREACVVMCEASDAHPWAQLERYLEMVRKVSAVSHPGLATVYSCGRYETGVYAACQWLPETVRGDSYAKRMEWRMAKLVLLTLAEALQKSAEAGVVHGALNARSFRKDAAGVPKACDFGDGVLLTGKMAEDPFAAPERKAGDECTVAADLYSFGVWAMGLLTGCSPHEIENGTMVDQPSDVPQGVFTVLRQMVSASAFKRPMGYLDLLTELKGEGRAAPMKNWKRGGETALKERPAEPKGGNMAAVVLLLVVLLVGTVGGWAFWKWKDGSRRPDGGDGQTAQDHPAVSVQTDASAENVGVASSSQSEGGRGEEKEVVQIPKKYRRLRPKPEDLKFDGESMRSYLSAVPSEFAAVEKDRAERVMGLRDYLFASLRMPYRPPKSEGLRLRDGSLLRGFIPMGTEASGLTVRPFDEVHQNLPVTNLKLEELEWSEIWGMLEYYGKIRKEMGEDLQSRKDLFEHYLNSAVACDWYGYRKEAVSFARKALKVNPKGRTIIERFGFGEELSKDKEP